MTTITITLNSEREANLLIEVARKFLSVESIKSGTKNLAIKGEPMNIKDFRSMIKKSEKSGFISVQQLEENIKKW